MLMPFVSRGRYDDAITRYVERNLEFRELLADFKALRLQGASIPEPVPTLERPQIDPVTAAITKASGRDRNLRVIMSKAAASARLRGEDDQAIIAAIESGVPDDEGIPA